jgi:hypothetical protein
MSEIGKVPGWTPDVADGSNGSNRIKSSRGIGNGQKTFPNVDGKRKPCCSLDLYRVIDNITAQKTGNVGRGNKLREIELFGDPSSHSVRGLAEHSVSRISEDPSGIPSFGSSKSPMGVFVGGSTFADRIVTR